MSRYDYFDELSNHGGGSSCGASDDDDDAHFDGCDDEVEESNSISDRPNRNKQLNDAFNNSNDNEIQDLTYERMIVHADIDCFYCQCEMKRRNITDPTIPIAIQQKHIIVTCNYPARALGITKLMSYNDAIRIAQQHTNVQIFNGSDLQYYRIYGRQIYNCFRTTIQSILPTNSTLIRKGCMDEMMADISSIVGIKCPVEQNKILQLLLRKQEEQQTNTGTSSNNENTTNTFSVPPFDQENVMIYTDDGHHYNYYDRKNTTTTNATTIAFTEDQSGVQTIFQCKNDAATGSHSYCHNSNVINENDQKNQSYSSSLVDKQRQLQMAIQLTQYIRQVVYRTTGFTLTFGLSYNPFLSKIASGLHKPGIVNVLLPPPIPKTIYSYSSSRHYQQQQLERRMIHSIPLRKLPGIGRRTMKALVPCLQQLHDHSNETTTTTATAPTVWVCGDLLRVPRNDIVRCLEQVRSGGDKSSAEQCTDILNLCNGIDHSTIIDDGGTIQKSLSVENSLRNGTIRTKDQVLHVVEDLYQRLPILIQDRMDFSDHPSMAYPTTIRVTVRSSFDGIGKGRENRKFITRSQQCKFDGRSLLLNRKSNKVGTASDTDHQAAVVLLRRTVTPLLQSLLFTSGQTINMTRIKICVANFQDIVINDSPNKHTREATTTTSRKKMKTINDYFK